MKKLTAKEMATAVNKYFKSLDMPIQYTVLGRMILYVDYSIPKERRGKREYGYAPVYVGKTDRRALEYDYTQVLKKQVAAV